MIDDLPNFGAIFGDRQTTTLIQGDGGTKRSGGRPSLKIKRLSTVGKDFRSFLSNRSDRLTVTRLGDGVTIRYPIQGGGVSPPLFGRRYVCPILDRFLLRAYPNNVDCFRNLLRRRTHLWVRRFAICGKRFNMFRRLGALQLVATVLTTAVCVPSLSPKTSSAEKDRFPYLRRT